MAIDGDELSYVTDGDKFVVIGEEKPVVHLDKCGRGKDACIFATVGGEGLRCERYSDLHETLVFRAVGVGGGSPMRSQRRPTQPWPKCWVEA